MSKNIPASTPSPKISDIIESVRKLSFAIESKSYLDLVIELPLRSIKDNDQLAAAQAMIDRLMKVTKLSKGEAMYLDALSDLVGVYEDEYFPIAPMSETETQRHLANDNKKA